MYYTSDRFSDSIAAINNICGIYCRNTGSHATAGQCQLIYFSTEGTTVCITTNGREPEDEILKKREDSFQF